MIKNRESVEREVKYPGGNFYWDLVSNGEIKDFGIFRENDSRRFLDGVKRDIEKMDVRPIESHGLQFVGEQFAERYGALGEDANGKSFWRLGGFTEQRAGVDKKPYVLAHEGSGKVAPMGERAVQQVQAQLQKEHVAQLAAERATRDRSPGRGFPR